MLEGTSPAGALWRESVSAPPIWSVRSRLTQQALLVYIMARLNASGSRRLLDRLDCSMLLLTGSSSPSYEETRSCRKYDKSEGGSYQ